MIFETLIKENRPQFVAKVKEIALFLMVQPEWIMFVMWFETARTMNHRVVNKIGATGLIQFMPSTAKELGTSCERLRFMTNVQQLEYVKIYLSKYKGRYHDFVDLYCAVFWPSAIGKPDTYNITSDIVAKQNPIFDINKDGDITKSEIRTRLLSMIPKEYTQYFTEEIV